MGNKAEISSNILVIHEVDYYVIAKRIKCVSLIRILDSFSG